MKYENVHRGIFLERVNRFVARVEIEGHETYVHVKNTGRCAELLFPGYTVYLEKSGTANRKTAYDLIAVEKKIQKDSVLINMDSMAPNKAAAEWISQDGLGEMQNLRAEVTIGDSRYDFCAKQNERDVIIEVKGCTLEENGVARFPDAPTQRGVKHIRGLIRHAREGARCILLIVIQMKGVHVFQPNWRTHREFGEALCEAQNAGVEIVAVDCNVRPGVVEIDQKIPVDLLYPH